MARQWPGTLVSGNELRQTASQWPGTPVEDPGLLDYAEGLVGGVNEGIALLAGAPVDLVNAGLTAVGLDSEYPIGGSESIRDAMSATFGRLKGAIGSDEDMFEQGPDTTTGRIVHRVGQEIGATAIPGAGLVGAGVRTIARPATTAAPSMARTFLEPIGRSPGRASIGETAAATGAGIGAGIAQEAAPGNVPFEMAGQIAGGLAPTALANTPTALASRLGSAAMKRVSPEAQRRAAQQTVKDHLADQLSSTRAREALEESDQVRREIPGFQPSLAERTGAPGLVRKQEDLENRLSGADLDAAVARRVANEQAIRSYARQKAPAADRGPALVIDTARRQVERLRGRIESASERTEMARRHVAGRLPQADKAAEGARLRAVLQDKLGDEQAAWAMVARESGLDDPNFIVPFGGFKKSLTDAFNSASLFATKSGQRVSVDPSVLRVVMDAKDVQSFPALAELRSDISAAIRQAERMPSIDDAQLRGLRAMRAAFDSALEAAVRNTEDLEIARRYADFRKGYREQFVEPYKQRASHDVLHRDPTGAYLVPDESVAKTYFQPGGVSAARQFKAVFGNDAAAKPALEAVALDSLRQTAVRNGVLDPRGYEYWLRAHGGVLVEFPELAGKVNSIGRANAALVQRQKVLARRAKAVEDALLSRELKAVAADTRTPDEGIARALHSPRKMSELTGRLRRSPQAQAALRRAIWDQVADAPPGELTAFLGKNMASLRAAGMTRQHVKALRIIDAARTISTRVPAPKGSAAIPTSIDAFVRQFGIRPDVLANRIRELHTGRSEPAYVLANVWANVMGRKIGQHMDDAYRVLLYDPEAADAMAKAITSGGKGPHARRLQARFFALGVTPLADDEHEQQSPWAGSPVQ